MTAVRSLSTAQIFDGRRFLGPSSLSLHPDGRIDEVAPLDGAGPFDVGLVLPGLVDAHVRVIGFRDYPLAAEPYAPHRAAVGLMNEAGIVAARDLGNHLDTFSHLRSIAGPHLVHSGPVIEAGEARVPWSRTVDTGEDLATEIEQLALSGVAWIHLGPTVDAPLVEVAIERARSLRLGVALQPGNTTAEKAIELGVDTIEHLPAVVAGALHRSPAQQVAAWATTDQHRLDDVVAAFREAPSTALVPMLLSWRRGAVVEEMVAEPRLDRLVDVAPFHRYLLEMRSGMGMNFGKKYLRRYLGVSPLKGADRRRFDAGWDRLLGMLCALVESGATVLAGSGATGVSLVPGFALHSELDIWASAGLPTETVLAAATSTPANHFRLDVGSLSSPASSVLTIPAAPSADTRSPSELLAGAERLDRSPTTQPTAVIAGGSR